ncbi:MAG TPA: hypothetical protein DEF45_01150 [Rhodopirellula sp.]|nr:hypothetical protein [Rhodopirellula sp.]
MSERNNSQKDPYRSPHEVADSKSVAKKWGWRSLVVVGFVLLALSVSGMLAFYTTATFNIQRARPIEVDAAQAVESGTSDLEEGPSAAEDDVLPDAESTQNP